MQTKEYRTVDKSDWIRGEWDDEPDKMQWPDEATGLPCLIVRGRSGALCGYVGVPDTHPWFQKDYADAIGACNENCEDGYHYGHWIDSAIDVHGGLTFSRMCADTADESKHICHVAEPGEPDHVWWFGFDCAHSGDICPSYAKKYGGCFGHGWDESYKGIAYVRREVTKLAAQLAAVK